MGISERLGHLIISVFNTLRAMKMDKKAWLDHLFYDIGRQATDFWLTGAWMQGGEVHFSKWVSCLATQENVRLLNGLNQRTALYNETILEYDGSWCNYMELIRQLREDGVAFLAYATPQHRSCHIHTYWDDSLILMSRQDRQAFRQKVIARYGCDSALSSDRHMVALEGCPHWKTGQIKRLIAHG